MHTICPSNAITIIGYGTKPQKSRLSTIKFPQQKQTFNYWRAIFKIPLLMKGIKNKTATGENNQFSLSQSLRNANVLKTQKEHKYCTHSIAGKNYSELWFTQTRLDSKVGDVVYLLNVLSQQTPNSTARFILQFEF